MRNADQRLQELLKKLAIPPDILRLEVLQESPLTLRRIEQWREDAQAALLEVLILDEESFSLDGKANAVSVLLPLIPTQMLLCSRQDGPSIAYDEWSLPKAQDLLSLSTISSPSTELVNLVLTDKLRPIFKSTPHPYLSSQTGRRVARPAGGNMALQDYYEGQQWKQHPGISNVVLWCVNALQPEAFEQMWHLIIPPVMAFLDDFEAKYKLQGAIIVRELLPRLPKGLVKRTGVDGLIQQSLRASLAHLQSFETPDLIVMAIRASIDLTLHTASPANVAKPTSDQFDQLCSLLGDGVISGIWLYAEDKPDVIHATFRVLPYLIKALGMGTLRFLQVLIPQVTHSLIPRPLVAPHRKIQLAALDVIVALLDTCVPRITSWKETILNGVGRCWVGIIDEERDAGHSEERDDVKKALQGFCVKFAQVFPSVLNDEYPKFLNADNTIFRGLLSGVAVPTHSDV